MLNAGPAGETHGAGPFAGRMRDRAAAYTKKSQTNGLGLIGGSPNWTRTNNLPVNSRLLCQLSYRGLLVLPCIFTAVLVSRGLPLRRGTDYMTIRPSRKRDTPSRVRCG